MAVAKPVEGWVRVCPLSEIARTYSIKAGTLELGVEKTGRWQSPSSSSTTARDEESTMTQQTVSLESLNAFVRKKASRFLKQPNATSIGVGFMI